VTINASEDKGIQAVEPAKILIDTTIRKLVNNLSASTICIFTAEPLDLCIQQNQLARCGQSLYAYPHQIY